MVKSSMAAATPAARAQNTTSASHHRAREATAALSTSATRTALGGGGIGRDQACHLLPHGGEPLGTLRRITQHRDHGRAAGGKAAQFIAQFLVQLGQPRAHGLGAIALTVDQQTDTLARDGGNRPACRGDLQRRFHGLVHGALPCGIRVVHGA